MTSAIRAKLDRLQALVHRREGWRADLDSVRRLHTRVLEAEHRLYPAALRRVAEGEGRHD